MDNFVRYGLVAKPDYTDSSVEGVRDLLRVLAEDDEMECTTIGTVGTTGYDGFLYALKL